MALKLFSWASSVFNNMMDSVASRMSSSLTSMYQNVGSNRNSASDYLGMYNRDPSVYYEILDDYPFFNKIVSAYENTLIEVMSNDAYKVTCKDKKVEEELNKAIKDYKIKDYQLEHLNECIKRGSYIGFLDNNGTTVSEIIQPFTNKFISRHNKFLSISLEESPVQIPFYEIYSYWYDVSVIDKITTKEIKDLNRNNRTENENILEELNDKINPDSEKELDEDEEFVKEFKQSLEVDTLIFRGKSLFEPYLKDFFKIFIREYVLDALSLSDYVKSNVITATMSGQKYDNKKVSEIINSIESLVNTDNINIMMSFSDPLQLINQINDKLINRTRVLPQIQDYSQLDEMKLPDVQIQLDKLRADIEVYKKDLEDKMSIPEDIINGVGNRWEVSSKYQDFMNVLNNILKTMSDSVRRFCVSYYYKKHKSYIEIDQIEHRFDLDKYVAPYMNRSNLSILSDRMKDITSLIEQASAVVELPAVDTKKFIDYLKSEMKSADPTLDGMINYDPKLIGKSEGDKSGFKFSRDKK